MKSFFLKNEKLIARVAMIAVLLGLIRSLSEPFRLQFYSTVPLTFEQAKPFMVGALVASLGLAGMTIFSFYSRYRIISLLALLTILGMIVVKYKFQI